MYGGNNVLGTSQLLAGLNQLWFAGPPLYNGQVDNDGICAVQLQWQRSYLNEIKNLGRGGTTDLYRYIAFHGNKSTADQFAMQIRKLALGFCVFSLRIYGQTVILHTVPLNYVIIIIIILSQNLTILNVPGVKFKLMRSTDSCCQQHLLSKWPLAWLHFWNSWLAVLFYIDKNLKST